MPTVETDAGERPSPFWTPLSSPLRWPVAAATLNVAVAHLPVIAPHLTEAPYMGEEFIVLAVACLCLSTAVILCDSSAVYAAVLATCGLAVIGYIATRSIAFPKLADDVGDWTQPLGVLSLVVESLAVGLAGTALWLTRRARAGVGDGTPSGPPTPYATEVTAPVDGWSDRSAAVR